MYITEIVGVELRSINDWENVFVGSDGHIYRNKTNQTVMAKETLWVSKISGYQTYRIMLTKTVDNKKVKKYINVSILVCAAFHGERPSAKEVSHLNGNSLDNRPENLMWETHKENIARKKAHGTDLIGCKNPKAALTKELALTVINLINSGMQTIDIVEKTGISRNVIKTIRTGKRYSDLFHLIDSECVKSNRDLRGYKHPRAKLDEKDLHNIRIMIMEGITDKLIANKFSVSSMAIYNIRKNKTHKGL
jgi:hypothetical protein